MGTITQAIVIKAPVEQVFAYHGDPRTALRWSANVQEIKDLSGDPLQVGTTWVAVGRVPPLPVTLTLRFRVLECVPPHLLGLAMEGLASATVTNRYTALDLSTTRLETTSEYRPPATFWGRAVDDGLVQRVLTRDVRKSMERLKRAIEEDARRG